MPPSIQLPLFPDHAAPSRIRPDRDEWGFYRMEVRLPLAIPSSFAGQNLGSASPDLFGRTLLLRHWGRIGTEGHRRLDRHPDTGAAINALA